MGYCLARAALKAGHKVTLISANTKLSKPKTASIIEVITSDEMFKAVKAEFERCDCLIMAAAVSDYKPEKNSKTKIKKEQSVLSLNLKPTKDILKWAGRNKKSNQILVGFALEDTNLLDNAEQKLKTKKLDMIVANQPSAIGSDKSSIHIKTKNTNWQTFENISKTISAKRVIEQINNLR